MNNLCSSDFCSTLLLWTWFVINFLSAANFEMYEMICVVISGLTFVWVLSVCSCYSVAFIEASLEELPVSANLGQSCLATKISAPGPSSLGGSATTSIPRTKASPEILQPHILQHKLSSYYKPIQKHYYRTKLSKTVIQDITLSSELKSSG